jgi:hypothetical protein
MTDQYGSKRALCDHLALLPDQPSNWDYVHNVRALQILSPWYHQPTAMSPAVFSRPPVGLTRDPELGAAPA